MIIKQARKIGLLNICYFLACGLIFIFAIYLRINEIDKYFSFGFDGEQAIELFRSQLIVKNLLELNFTDDYWVGPTATNNLNIGHLYHGPLIHWILIPIGILTNFNPKMVVWLFVVLGILTVFLIYLTTKKIAGNIAALFALIISTSSFVLVNYSRTQWNPSLVPFLSSMSIYLYLKISDKKNRSELKVVMFFISVFLLSQAHISTYITSFILLFLVFINRKKILKSKTSIIIFLLSILLQIFLILIMLGQSNFAIFHQLFKLDGTNINILNVFSFKENILSFNEFFGFVLFHQFPYKQTLAYLLSFFIAVESFMFLLRTKIKIDNKTFFLQKELLIFIPIILFTHLLLIAYQGNADRTMIVSNSVAQFVPIIYVLFAVVVGYLIKNLFSRVFIFTILGFIFLVNFQQINIDIFSRQSYGPTYDDKVELVSYLSNENVKNYKYEVFYEISDMAGNDELLFLIRQNNLDLPQKYNNKIDWEILTLKDETPKITYLFQSNLSSFDEKISDDFLKSNNITQFEKKNLGKFWVYKFTIK